MLQTILGAGGAIGKDLARELRPYTDRIRLVSRHPQKINPGDELFPADLDDPQMVDKAVAGSSVVYLVIGFDYKLAVWRKKWPALMRACIDACARHKAKLVFFDNVYLYDQDAVTHMTEESPVNPPSEKGKVRAEIADMLWNAVREGRIRALVARSADFYGPGNEKSFLMEVVYKNFLKKKKANWFADAHKVHSFTYTPDAAKATAMLGNTEDAYNQTWHLPTDPQKLTGEQFIHLFAAKMQVSPGYSVLRSWLVRLLGLFIPFLREMPEMMYQYDRDYFFDSSKFNKRFAFRPTPYAEGVDKVIASGRTS